MFKKLIEIYNEKVTDKHLREEIQNIISNQKPRIKICKQEKGLHDRYALFTYKYIGRDIQYKAYLHDYWMRLSDLEEMSLPLLAGGDKQSVLNFKFCTINNANAKFSDKEMEYLAMAIASDILEIFGRYG